MNNRAETNGSLTNAYKQNIASSKPTLNGKLVGTSTPIINRMLLCISHIFFHHFPAFNMFGFYLMTPEFIY